MSGTTLLPVECGVWLPPQGSELRYLLVDSISGDYNMKSQALWSPARPIYGKLCNGEWGVKMWPCTKSVDRSMHARDVFGDAEVDVIPE